MSVTFSVVPTSGPATVGTHASTGSAGLIDDALPLPDDQRRLL